MFIGDNMLRFYEKLLISIVIFLGVVIGTASIIGNYVNQVEKQKQEENNRIVIG